MPEIKNRANIVPDIKIEQVECRNVKIKLNRVQDIKMEQIVAEINIEQTECRK